MSKEDKINRLRGAMYSRQVPPSFGMERRHVLPQQRSALPQDWNKPEDAVTTPGLRIANQAIRYTRTALWWMLGVALLFFLVSAGIFAWYVFGGFATGVKNENIDIQINGPLSVVGGEASQFEVVVTNKNKSPLEYADLLVTYPVGTRSVTDLSTDLPQYRVSLGTIEAGGTRKGTISAVLVGQGGQSAQIKVEVEYQVAGANAIFAASKDYDFTFAASPVTISVESKTEVAPGQDVDLVATVSANTNSVLKDVLFELEAPFGFTLTNASPLPAKDLQWKLGTMRPGESKTIQIRGTLKGQSGDTRTFRFSAGTSENTSGTGVMVPIAQSVRQIAITQPFIGLDMAIGGATGTNVVVQPGDTVSVTISWINQLDTAIRNAVIIASLDGLSLSQTDIKTNDGFYQSSDGTIRFDTETSRGKLNQLEPGDSGTLGFTFVVPSGVAIENVRNPSLNITVSASGDRSDADNVPQTLRSSVVRTVKVGTTATAVAQGFYHGNIFGTSGTVPPQVGKETAYAILWTLGNSTNPIENGVFSGKLPAYVSWKGVTSPTSENISFDTHTNTVIWNAGSVPAGVSGGSVRQVAFEVGFLPSASQVDTAPNLITGQTFSGKDAFTGVGISESVQNITTLLPNDPGFVSTEAQVVE